jgi:hypothetical protein
LKLDSNKVQAPLTTKESTTAKEASRFVKATQYYRKFIPGFSQTALPLYKYTLKMKQQGKRSPLQQITFSAEDRRSFNDLKRFLTTDLILRIPNNHLSFNLQTDASDECIGAVLLQTYPNSDLLLAYYRQNFSATQKKWSAT